MKPCPNPECESPTAARIDDEWASDSSFAVVCFGCGMEGPRASSEAEAIRLWDLLPREVQP